MAIPVEECVIAEGPHSTPRTGGSRVRRVLLTDYPSVETKRTRGGFVLVGMLMVVATVFDRKKKAIYRWSEEGEFRENGNDHG